MMDTDMTSPLDSSFDRLETAFSDTSGKLVRKINIECERVSKCKKDLHEKENELRVAKEDMTRLKEIKIQNEKYLKSVQKRLEDLKLSNAQLKSDVSKLAEEKDKVVKSCNEQEQHMREKIAFYEEKWREKYIAHFSKNPRMLEKERRITEVHELKERLRILTEEEKKCEKKLFRAKCKRNLFTERSMLYPFQHFVINVAKIYVETEEIYAECEKVSKEMASIENRMNSELHTYDNRNPMLSTKSSLDIFMNSSENTDKEINNSENNSSYLNVEIQENAYRELELTKDVNFEVNVNVETNSSNKCIKSFPKDLSSASKNANQISFSNTDYVSNHVNEIDDTTKARKVLSDEPRARKWMERLKIFVPKFRTLPEENDKHFTEGDSNAMKPVGVMNTKIERKSKTNLPPIYLNDEKCDANSKISENTVRVATPLKTPSIKESVQHIISPVVKNVTFQDTSLEVQQNLPQQASFKSISKYFTRIVEETELMGCDKERIYVKRDVVKSVRKDSIQSNKTEVKGVVEEEIIGTQEHLKQAAVMFTESMDVDEQSNKRKFEKIMEPETFKATAENGALNISLSETYHEKETESNLEHHKNNVYSSVLNENETINEDQNTCVQSGEIQSEMPYQHQNDKNKVLNAVSIESVSDNIMVDASKQHQSHIFPGMSIPQASAVKNCDPEKDAETMTSKEVTTCEENLQRIPANAFLIDVNINTKLPEPFPAKSVSPSPVEPSLKNSEPDLKIQTDSNPKAPSLIDSNLKTPLTRQLQNTEEYLTDANALSSSSPGFTFATRLMYPTSAACAKQNMPETIPQNPQNSLFSQMAFLNNSPKNIAFSRTQSPDDGQSEFLTADYENYLTDSPPVIKGTEKSMFAFAEDSPENEGQNDFFPLFASDNGEANRDTGKGGFTFNFAGSSQTKSPEGNQGFRFLF